MFYLIMVFWLQDNVWSQNWACVTKLGSLETLDQINVNGTLSVSWIVLNILSSLLLTS